MIPLRSAAFSPLFGRIEIGKGTDEKGQSNIFGGSPPAPVFGSADEEEFDGGSGGGTGGGDGTGDGTGIGEGTQPGTLPGDISDILGDGGATDGTPDWDHGDPSGGDVYAGGNPDFDESAGGGYFGSDGSWHPADDGLDEFGFPIGDILDEILGDEDAPEVDDDIGEPSTGGDNPFQGVDDRVEDIDWESQINIPQGDLYEEGNKPQSTGDWIKMAEEWAKANPDSEYVTPESSSTESGGGGDVPLPVGDIVDNPDGSTTMLGDLEADQWGNFNLDDVDWNVAMGGDESDAAQTFEDYVDMVGGMNNVDWGVIADTVGLGGIFDSGAIDPMANQDAVRNLVSGEGAGMPGSTEGVTGDGGFFGADQGWGAAPMELGKAAVTALSGESYNSEDWGNAYMTTMLSMIPFVGPFAALGFNMFGGFGGEEGPTDQQIKGANLAIAQNAWQSSTGRRAPVSPTAGFGSFGDMSIDGGSPMYEPFIDREFQFDPNALYSYPDADPVGYSGGTPGLAEDYTIGSVGMTEGMTDEAFFNAWGNANPDYDPYDINAMANSMINFSNEIGMPNYQWESDLAKHDAYAHTASGWDADMEAWKEENPEAFRQQLSDYQDWTSAWFNEVDPEGPAGATPYGQAYTSGLIGSATGSSPFGINFRF